MLYRFRYTASLPRIDQNDVLPESRAASRDSNGHLASFGLGDVTISPILSLIDTGVSNLLGQFSIRS